MNDVGIYKNTYIFYIINMIAIIFYSFTTVSILLMAITSVTSSIHFVLAGTAFMLSLYLWVYSVAKVLHNAFPVAVRLNIVDSLTNEKEKDHE